MASLTLKGNPVHTLGELPKIGTAFADFKLVKTDLSIATLDEFKGKKIIFNIFPSIDTGTCAASVRKFNEEATLLENTVVLCISKDLPFAQARFCGAEGIKNVISLSDFRNDAFGKNNGLIITDSPLEGLLSRAIIIVDEKGIVTYTEQVSEIVDEPNYETALKSLNQK